MDSLLFKENLELRVSHNLSFLSERRLRRYANFRIADRHQREKLALRDLDGCFNSFTLYPPRVTYEERLRCKVLTYDVLRYPY